MGIVNEDYFEIIDTETKAYLLGFITADGSINDTRKTKTLQVHLSNRDEYLIKLLESEIGNTVKTYYSDNYKSIAFRATSNKLCDDLSVYGVVARKTGNEVLAFNLIQPSLRNHYLRGLIDGDGWISNTKYQYGIRRAIGFCGSKESCEQMSEFLNSTLGTYPVKASKVLGKNNYKINYLGKKDIKEIVKYLYTGANVYLERKYRVAMVKLPETKNPRAIRKW